MLKLASGTSLAAVAAFMAFASLAQVSPAHASPAPTDQAQPCYGVNSCKGQSDCKSGDHACKGQNSCKGQGFKDLTASVCQAQNGSQTPPAK
jgi:uncharacterized membrane protein